MKKLILISFLVLMLFGCSLMETPSSKVEEYLDNYNSLNDDVLSNLDTTVEDENLSEDNKTIYKQVLKRQYKDLKYEIKDEIIDGDNAQVVTKITVYDLLKKESSNRSATYKFSSFVFINNLTHIFSGCSSLGNIASTSLGKSSCLYLSSFLSYNSSLKLSS